MSSILHRIFVSKHKHKKMFIRRKKKYKKFLGLKTLKAVLYTQLCLPYKQQVSEKKAIKKVRIRKRVNKIPRRLVKFPMLKSLPARTRRQEVTLAQADIENFKDIICKNTVEKIPEEKFQAFVPQVIWNKMTSQQKRIHIKKRKEFAIKKLNQASLGPRYNFSSRGLRPALSRLRFAGRKQYLKNLVRFARITTYDKSAAFDKQMDKKLYIREVKNTVQTRNKIRAKGTMYRGLTYSSILPKETSNLIF